MTITSSEHRAARATICPICAAGVGETCVGVYRENSHYARVHEHRAEARPSPSADFVLQHASMLRIVLTPRCTLRCSRYKGHDTVTVQGTASGDPILGRYLLRQIEPFLRTGLLRLEGTDGRTSYVATRRGEQLAIALSLTTSAEAVTATSG